MAEPRIVVVEDAAELDRTGADLVAGVIGSAPSASVVAATGRTPMGLYAELSARRRAGGLDPSGITVLQLDEYLGLEPGDHRSLGGWMRRSFVEPLGIAEDAVIGLPLDGDLHRACAVFDRDLEARGGIDLAVLGLGLNGHIGFNEPPAGADTTTRVVALEPGTLAANAGYWGSASDVPARAVTMGMRQILAARTIVLLASGAGKCGILRRTLEGAVGADVPASLLRRTDADVTVLVDRAAWGGG